MTIRIAVVLALSVVAAAPAAETEVTSPAVEQLRHAAGTWDVTTEMIGADGSVARTAAGTYDFEWVVPDRVLLGRTEHPGLGQAAGLLFYYQESKDLISMASVSADGHLWVMTGAGDEEVRKTPSTVMSDGSTLELRFTRYNVQPNSFESKMEVSTDGGKSWSLGNHQVFRRRRSPAAED